MNKWSRLGLEGLNDSRNELDYQKYKKSKVPY